MRNVIAVAPLLFSTSAMAGTSAGQGMGSQFARFDPVVKRAASCGRRM